MIVLIMLSFWLKSWLRVEYNFSTKNISRTTNIMVEQKPDNDTNEKGEDGDDAEEKVVHDHPVFKTIIDGDMESMRNYFEVEGVSLELEDSTGMTPLMHASWKGKYEVAKYLITQGTIFRL